MKAFTVAFFLLIASHSFAQSNSTVSFPQDFTGVWKGTLEWYRQGASEPRNINMELYILPSKDTVGQYSWHLVYGTVSKDSRPYILKQVDSAGNHWMIDELNGIKLDQYWIGNRFCGSFTVQNATIVNSYYIENGDLIAEFISWPSKPKATTGQGNEDSPFVDSYGIKSYQRAVLKKQ